MGHGHVRLHEHALAEKIHFIRGAIAEEDFDSYSIPRFSCVPQIETILVESPELGPQGGGEGQGCARRADSL